VWALGEVDVLATLTALCALVGATVLITAAAIITAGAACRLYDETYRSVARVRACRAWRRMCEVRKRLDWALRERVGPAVEAVAKATAAVERWGRWACQSNWIGLVAVAAALMLWVEPFALMAFRPLPSAWSGYTLILIHITLLISSCGGVISVAETKSQLGIAALALSFFFCVFAFILIITNTQLYLFY
jgi:hypothetical protein